MLRRKGVRSISPNNSSTFTVKHAVTRIYYTYLSGKGIFKAYKNVQCMYVSIFQWHGVQERLPLVSRLLRVSV